MDLFIKFSIQLYTLRLPSLCIYLSLIRMSLISLILLIHLQYIVSFLFYGSNNQSTFRIDPCCCCLPNSILCACIYVQHTENKFALWFQINIRAPPNQTPTCRFAMIFPQRHIDILGPCLCKLMLHKSS